MKYLDREVVNVIHMHVKNVLPALLYVFTLHCFKPFTIAIEGWIFLVYLSVNLEIESIITFNGALFYFYIFQITIF